MVDINITATSNDPAKLSEFAAYVISWNNRIWWKQAYHEAREMRRLGNNPSEIHSAIEAAYGDYNPRFPQAINLATSAVYPYTPPTPPNDSNWSLANCRPR